MAGQVHHNVAEHHMKLPVTLTQAHDMGNSRKLHSVELQRVASSSIA